MREATAAHVHDGMSVAIEGFTAFICFAAGHEIIRQRRRDLTLIRMTPDLIYDQMVAAGMPRHVRETGCPKTKIAAWIEGEARLNGVA
jgi:glutaconate CoA-transferase subunit A